MSKLTARTRWLAISISVALCVGVFAVVSRDHVVAQPPAATGTPPTTSPFPMRLVSADGEGPALFMSNASDALGVGYLSRGVEIELAEAPTQGRALVRIRGGMRVRAYIALERVSAIVQRRGRLRGTPAYLGGGDRVRFLGVDPDGRARLLAQVVVGARTLDFTGSYPVVGIGSVAPAPGPDTTPPGDARLLRTMSPVRVLDAAGGNVIETLAAGDIPCRVMGAESGGYSVLFGRGPYLAGFITETPDASSSVDRASLPTVPQGRVPGRLAADTHLPLVNIAAGTRVTFAAQTVAILDAPGYARVVARHEPSGEADVFIAVDDTVAVRGMIPLEALGSPVQ